MADSPYLNIHFTDVDPLSHEVAQARLQILDDLSPREEYMRGWYRQEKWEKNAFTLTTLIKDHTGELIGMSSCKLLPDQTLKILCHLHLMRKLRVRYRSLPQTDLIPRYVQQARTLGAKGVWYSIHSFDRRHARLANSIVRGMNGGRVDRQFQPYLRAFEFSGQVLYNHVWQDKFYFGLDEA